MTPSLHNAILRTRALAAKPDALAPNTQNDLIFLCDALMLIAANAEHVDDRDAVPIFEVRLDCDWRLASKGFIPCVAAAVEHDREAIES